MMTVAINHEWYDEIKDLVATANPHSYIEIQCGIKRAMVEVDVDEVEFNKISKELGWM